MPSFLMTVLRALLCFAFLLPSSVAWAASEPANILVQIEADGGPAGDAFTVNFISEDGKFHSFLSASTEVSAELPEGTYTVLVIRANDQKTLQVTATATSQPLTLQVAMPPMSPDTPRMRLVQIAASGAEPTDRGWFWQFVQGDRIVASMAVAEPEMTIALPIGGYVIRLRRGRDEQETRAALEVSQGEGALDVAFEWSPRAISDDAVARARIVPRAAGAEANSNAPTAPEAPAAALTDLTATYDAQMAQIVVRITAGAADLDGGTIWLTDGKGPGGLDVAFIDQRGEARFSTLGVSSKQLAVEIRDANGLNTQARTIVEGWK